MRQYGGLRFDRIVFAVLRHFLSSYAFLLFQMFGLYRVKVVQKRSEIDIRMPRDGFYSYFISKKKAMVIKCNANTIAYYLML